MTSRRGFIRRRARSALRFGVTMYCRDGDLVYVARELEAGSPEKLAALLTQTLEAMRAHVARYPEASAEPARTAE